MKNNTNKKNTKKYQKSGARKFIAVFLVLGMILPFLASVIALVTAL